jgi:hypothetical protein
LANGCRPDSSATAANGQTKEASMGDIPVAIKKLKVASSNIETVF